MQKRWLVKTPVESTTLEEFRSILKVDRIVAELLMQRGITSFEDAETFFRPKLDQLHNPFLMKDLKRAVDRVNFGDCKGRKNLVVWRLRCGWNDRGRTIIWIFD